MSSPTSLAAYPASPMALDPGTQKADQAAVGSVQRPAVMVEESTLPAPTQPTAYAEPPARPAVGSEPARPPSRGIPNLAAPAEQPKSKLLTPDEKAKVIAELEALAKNQSAALGKRAKSDCAADAKVTPGQRVASAAREC